MECTTTGGAAPTTPLLAKEAALDARTRLMLFYETGISAAQLLVMDDAHIRHELMSTHRVPALRFVAAKIGPSWLRERGFDSVEALVGMGFDSLHLAASEAFCEELASEYGREAAVSAFLRTPEDAVALAGSPATAVLQIRACALLQACVGSPPHAVAVMQQLTPATALDGVTADLLLDAGVRLRTLGQCGITLHDLVTKTGATPLHLSKLGFGV